ncbi:ABATE domain-containing protein [Kitasatospora sp. NBC_01287]|uniref:CGNR zinc finger domain-containing protein n=1 Tax=Kitasatospora sp. NBC_01287 TaxID=2903573 RepID=UPI00224DFC89|nr:ABATE domain-containing protein [Kitasatospora sp. NBC_01287]MCX4744101.1 ABATE domain-containing protein [Kitasatospora sp. NBC_01287]
MDRCLALELASTIRHDGDGGVADDLSDAPGLTRWLSERAELLAGAVGTTPHTAGSTTDSTTRFTTGSTTGFTAGETDRAAVVAVREAVRALFAHAVSPAPPSPADAQRLISVADALERLNAAARRVPVSPRLTWPADGPPLRQLVAPGATRDPLDALTAALARSAIDFLAGPRREQLRACTAPRCVRYFLKGHGRQEFCKPSCSNRARAARHYQRHHEPATASRTTKD